MRIVTRPDFDGVVCAALLYEVEAISRPIRWVEPNEMQKGEVDVEPDDIIANLPYHDRCGLWFDHHFTNTPGRPFKGLFKLAPSAAGVIYEYYRGRFQRDYDELIRETDRIDAADLTEEEVQHPENHPYVILSMTVSGRNRSDEPYWNHLTQLLRRRVIGEIHQDPEVRRRCREAIDQNRRFKTIVENHTRMEDGVSITDFRAFAHAPSGNRFLVYSLFPAARVSVKIRYDDNRKDRIIIGLGHSIFNRSCNVNVGRLLARFGGGGHRGAGSCTVPEDRFDEVLAEIVTELIRNRPDDDRS